MTYQIIYLSLFLIGLGLAIAQHGKPKEGKHNIWTKLFASAVVMFILLKGGFFDCFL